MAAYEVLLLNTAIPQIQAAQSGDTYVVPRDIAFSAALTLSAGTANGVPYLNGSKVLTSGSALTFDGTNLGIGTNSPNAKLYVAGTNPYVYIGDGNSPGASDKIIGVGYSTTNNYGDIFAFQNGVGAKDIVMQRLGGNLGLGVTPSTGGYGIAYQFAHAGNGGAITAQSISANNYPVNITANAISSGVSTWKYFNTDASSASRYQQVSGVHSWHTAASGTAGNPITFTQAMTLDASGYLLVGTTSFGAAYNGGIGIGPNAIGTNVSAILVGHVTGAASGDQYMIFGYGGGSIGSITQNGTTGVLYNITSDYRLKNVVGAVTGAGARIDALKPVDYTWKADGSAARGFLAHEFQEIYPNSVIGTKDAVDEEGKPIHQQMQASTSEVIADLVAELQSLRARVAQLEGK